MKLRLSHIVKAGLATSLWVIICIIIFVGFAGELSWTAIFLFALFVYASFMLWWVALDKRVAPIELLFWLFSTNYLLLPAISQSMFRTFYWSAYKSYAEESLLFACLVIAIGLFAFGIGSSFGRKKMRSVNMDGAKLGLLSRTLEPRWRLQIFLVVILAGLAGLVTILGMDFFTSRRMSQLSQVDSLAEMGLLLSLPRALGLGVLLISLTLLVQRWRNNKKIAPSVLVILLFAVGINAIVNYPLSLARFWIFGFLISLIWIAFPLVTASWRSAFLISMTVMQFTIFPLFSQITRGTGWIGGLDIESIRRYMRYGDFDGFQSIVNSLLYIQENGFEMGRSLVSVALFFVPRSFWENKASPLGVGAADYMGYAFTNLSAPIYGELYADFGLVSLILGMMFIGWGISVADGYYNHLVRRKRFGVGVLLVGTLAGFIIIILRGSLLGVVSPIATLFGVLIIASWLSKPKRRVYNRNHSGEGATNP